jgi:hypothetical protein
MSNRKAGATGRQWGGFFGNTAKAQEPPTPDEAKAIGLEDHQQVDDGAHPGLPTLPPASPVVTPILDSGGSRLPKHRTPLPPGTVIVVESAAKQAANVVPVREAPVQAVVQPLPSATFPAPAVEPLLDATLEPAAVELAPMLPVAPGDFVPRAYSLMPALTDEVASPPLPVSVEVRSYDFPAPSIAELDMSTTSMPPQGVTNGPVATVFPAGGSATFTRLLPTSGASPIIVVPPMLADEAPASHADATRTTPDNPTPTTPAVPIVVAPPATSTIDSSPSTGGNTPPITGDLPPAGGGDTSPDMPAPLPALSANPPGIGLTIADILRLAAQLTAERASGEDAATKAKEDFKVDPEKVKDLRERLFKETEELYQKASTTVNDSPAIETYCLDLLKKARLNLLNGETAGEISQAEYYLEEVRAKLGRSQDPIPRAEKKNVLGIIVWSVGFWLLCVPLALLPWLAPTGLVPYLNLKLPLEVLPLLATVGWGGIGGVIGTLYNMTWFVQMREYDPAYNLDYIVRPIKGFIAGGVMNLIFTTGIATLGASQAAAATDKGSFGFALVYLFAALAGFKQEYVYEWFDSILKVFFKTPPLTPKQLDASLK